MIDERPESPNTWFKAPDWSFAHRISERNEDETLCWLRIPEGSVLLKAEQYDQRCPRCSSVVGGHAL